MSESFRRLASFAGFGCLALFVLTSLVFPAEATAQSKSRADRRAELEAEVDARQAPSRALRPRARIQASSASETEESEDTATVEADAAAPAPQVVGSEPAGQKTRAKTRAKSRQKSRSRQAREAASAPAEDVQHEPPSALPPAQKTSAQKVPVQVAEPLVEAAEAEAWEEISAAEQAPPPPNLDIQLDAARVLIAKRRLDEATEALSDIETALSATIRSGTFDADAAGRLVDIRIELAQALIRDGQRAEALSVLDAAFAEAAGFPGLSSRRGPVLNARMDLVLQLADSGDFEDAFQELATAPAMDLLESEQARIREVELELAQRVAARAAELAAEGSHPRALQELSRLGSLAPGAEEVQEVFENARGDVLANLGDSIKVNLAKAQFSQATQALNAVAQVDEQPVQVAETVARLRLELASEQIKAGQERQALALLEVVENSEDLEEGPSEVAKARLALAQRRIEGGRPLQALPVLEAVEGGEKTPNEIKEEAALLRVSALAKHAEKQPDDGLKRLEGVAGHEASEKVADAIAMARIGVAQAMARRGRQPVALAALERTAAHDANSETVSHAIAEARLDVARSYADASRHQAALKVLDEIEALENPPEVARQLVLDRLEYLLTQSRPDEAKADAIVVAMLRKDPDGEIFEQAIDEVKAIVANIRKERALIVLDEPGALRPDRPVRLRARVLDPKAEVASLQLRYREMGTEQWDSEDMRRTTGDWTGFIRRPDALAPPGVSDDYQVEFIIEAQSETGRTVDSYGSRENPALLDISTARWEEAERIRRESQPVVSELPEIVLSPAPELAPAKPWYTRWYTIAGAGAVVVGTAAVVTAVILSQPSELPDHHTRIDLP